VPPTATSATQDDVGYYLAGGDIHDLKFFSSLMLIGAKNLVSMPDFLSHCAPELRALLKVVSRKITAVTW